MDGPDRAHHDAQHSAAAIAQHLLDATGIALLAADFAGFSQHFALPTNIATPSGAARLETVEDLQKMFDAVVRFYRDLGTAELDRRVQLAVFDGPDRVRYDHITHIRGRDGAVLQGPVASHSVAERRGSGWVVVSSQYVVPSDTAQDAALLTTIPRDERPEGSPEALAIFQTNLDAVTRGYLDGDYRQLQQALLLPLFKQGSAGSQVFATDADLRADFDAYMLRFRIHGITDIVRTAKSAKFLGPDRLFGTLRTYVLARTRLVVPSYVSAATLERGEDGVWRMTSIMHPLESLTIDRLPST